jgi:hypothetical protein
LKSGFIKNHLHFQPFIEGEQVILVTDDAALQWAQVYGQLASLFLEGLKTMLCRLNREMERLHMVHEPQVWADRPDYATEARLEALERIDVWSDAVDHGVAFQRGLQEKEAWIALVKERNLSDTGDWPC